ncbi:MAG: GTP-binding protein [Gammaproteobacteria bacterium]|nr:GTP-binding protein [Gammaproteobacteria bacterium]MBT5204327.1 GTP-binding protein [Gammaproteobacteria bacterium]MBT6244876.1 GTP-binding protein [Gammaproteobacteria bacterium]
MIPITIISGYLGSGKTTFINQLLATDLLPRNTAILVNDFGDINIDANLIDQVSGDGAIVSLKNGCVCCMLQDDLAQTFEVLRTTEIDQVLLEASGVALPDKLRAQCHYPGYFPQHCAVLVDAENFDNKKHDKYVGSLVQQQVLQADTIIITKLDLASSFELRVRDHSNKTSSSATTLPKQYRVTDPDLTDRLLQLVKTTALNTSSDLATFKTFTLLQHTTIELEELSELLARVPTQIERIKGFVATPDGLQLVHRVGSRCSIEPVDSEQNPGLVFIYPQAAADPLTILQQDWAPWMSLSTSRSNNQP